MKKKTKWMNEWKKKNDDELKPNIDYNNNNRWQRQRQFL